MSSHPCKIQRDKEELRQMDQITTKLLTMHKAVHLRDERLCIKKKKEEQNSSEVRTPWIQ